MQSLIVLKMIKFILQLEVIRIIRYYRGKTLEECVENKKNIVSSNSTYIAVES